MEFGSRRDGKPAGPKGPAVQKAESLEGGGTPKGRSMVDLPVPGGAPSRRDRLMAWAQENVTIRPDYAPTGNDPLPVYVIKEGNGYSCHGFDVVEGLTQKYAGWLGVDPPKTEKGTIEAYVAYREMAEMVLEKCRTERVKCPVELTPQLIGLEGKRVEVVDRHGDKRRFWVGKSTGDIPIHLEVNNTRSMGGPAVMGAPFQSVTVVRESR